MNGTHLIGITPTGEGQSLIVDPEGYVRTRKPGASSGILTDVLNLDDVERVRTFSTAGLNRVWSQFRDDDPVLELPMYEGWIHPRQWRQKRKSAQSP